MAAKAVASPRKGVILVKYRHAIFSGKPEFVMVHTCWSGQSNKPIRRTEESHLVQGACPESEEEVGVASPSMTKPHLAVGEGYCGL